MKKKILIDTHFYEHRLGGLPKDKLETEQLYKLAVNQKAVEHR